MSESPVLKPRRPLRLIVCDDDDLFHITSDLALKGHGEVAHVQNCDEAYQRLTTVGADVLLLDIQMRSDSEGLDYLPKFREADDQLAIIMTSALDDFRTVREAMRRGADDYVPKDFAINELYITIEQVLDRRALILRKNQKEFEALTTQRRHRLIGDDPKMVELRRLIEKLRQSPANVVITGETGVGKEVVARSLRGHLPDGTLMPFVAIDAATIQSSLAESLLFGFEKGAFTGAERATKGIFEQAHGGIVYIDEIANLPLEIQPKLLRILQEREVTRLGSSRVIELDFKLICATNQPLEELVQTGRFKADLYQRLAVIPIVVPPLRSRKGDIPKLVEFFVERHLEKARRPHTTVRFTPEALALLDRYDWPGNVRELANTIAYILTLSEDSEIDVADLPPRLRASPPIATQSEPPSFSAVVPSAGTASLPSGVSEPSGAQDTVAGDLYTRLGRYERELIAQALDAHAYNVSKTAIALGMDRSHLYAKLKEHGLQRPGRAP